MAASSPDEKLNDITEIETKRKVDLENSKQQDRQIRGTANLQEKDTLADMEIEDSRAVPSSAVNRGSVQDSQKRQKAVEDKPLPEDTEEKNQSKDEEPAEDDNQDKKEDNSGESESEELEDEEKEKPDDENEEENPDEDSEDEDEEAEDEEKNPDEDNENPEKQGESDGSEAAESEAELGAGEAAGAEVGAAETAAGAGAAEGAAAAAGAEAGVVAGAGTVAATSPIWGVALAVIGVIIVLLLLVFFVFVSMVVQCNDKTISGVGTRILSTGTSFIGIIPADVCKQLAINNFGNGSSGGGGASGIFEPALVNLAVSVKAGVDGRATACMADKVKTIYDLAQAATPPIEFEITGAYEPRTTASGGVSAHSRGEAVDIGLRPPAALRSNDPRIARLVAIARQVGFVPPAGNTLDEYANPAPNATAGHVHVEFNIPSDGGTFCK